MSGGVWVVSRCLLGEPCRYDGASRESAAVRAFLASAGGTVCAVCPECDCGLGCPRPPMSLSRDAGGVVRLTDERGVEQTERLLAWCGACVERLRGQDVRGFVLKSRSPSCGVGNTPVAGCEHPGDGLFAAAARAAFPGVPLLSEWEVPGGAEALSESTLLKRVERVARMLLAGSEACHDWDHTLRVRANARRLMEREPCDRQVVEAATLLHDIGRPAEVASGGRLDHAAHGASLAEEWLRAVGVRDESLVRRVGRCVRCHRFRSREPGACPTTLEERIVYDADKLDSIGAIGIGRAFHFAGGLGARVHNRASEALAGASYGREDSAYREYLVKLRHVHGRMLTAAGRELAERRHRFMEAFFAELNAECGLEEETTAPKK